MNERTRSRTTPQALVGLFLVLVGALFLLDNLGVVDARRVWHYWPLILVAVGITRVANPRRRGEQLWGGIEIAVGLLLLMRYLGLLRLSFRQMWPAALVLGGIYMIWQASRRDRAPGEAASPWGGVSFGQPGATSVAGDLREFAIFGGGTRIVRSPDFRGGRITAIAGGFDIDLREAVIVGDGASIEVSFFMGGAVFRVPESWNVVVNVTHFLGGTDHKARPARPASELPVKTLTIHGSTIMGGLEIRN